MTDEDAAIVRAIMFLERAEAAWREAYGEIPDRLRAHAMAAVPVASRSVEPWDVGSALALVRVRLVEARK